MGIRGLVWVWAGVVGCSGLKGDDSGAGSNPCDAGADNGGWPAAVEPACEGETIVVNLGAGATVDLNWASESDIACFPDTEFVNFEGSHRFYWFAQPESSTLSATVSPDSDVDASVYLIQSGTDRFEVPPDVVAAVTCEADYDAQDDSNPGEPQTASVTATTNPYNVLIGVAGAAGQTSGTVELSVSLEK